MLARIRKALVAGLGAGVGSAVAVVAKGDWHLDSTTFSQALAALILAGVPVGWATWRTENAKPPLAAGGIVTDPHRPYDV
jgi:hypothetical protein